MEDLWEVSELLLKTRFGMHWKEGLAMLCRPEAGQVSRVLLPPHFRLRDDQP
jgi:hypothetical protein